MMREILQDLNKHTIAEETGISYARLRKYAAGRLKTLTSEEATLIHQYLLKIAEIFNKGE